MFFIHSAGVPQLLRQKWAAVSMELQAAVQLAPFRNRVVRLAAEDEAAVAPLLDTLAAEWGGELAIGSYPVSLLRYGDLHCMLRRYTQGACHLLETVVCRLFTTKWPGGTLNTWRSGDDGRTVAERLQVRF
jgi:hypothetical protein